MSALERAWVGLAILTALSTTIAISPLPAPYSGALILVCAWAKSRLIFLWYLELAPVPGWRAGILTGLALFMLVLLGLYMAA